jgi:hypothetical protein
MPAELDDSLEHYGLELEPELEGLAWYYETDREAARHSAKLKGPLAL